MKVIKSLFVFLLIGLLTSCNNFKVMTKCPDGIIEWVDMVMIQDIKYQHHFPDSPDENQQISVEKGKELGKVTYKMADRACSNHKMRNGDATFLEEGTTIHAIEGYPSSLIVFANDKVYVAETHPKATTAGELYPIDNLVKDIHIESTEDGRRVHSFSQESKDHFLKIWPTLKLVDRETLYDQDGTSVFIEIELNNGVSFREVYWPQSNTFHSGIVGNKEIKEIVEYELSMITK
ncbi:hypothetical protein FZW96_16520 [Bacillus sp. BGMRC 2118]|nr:hypothetical protein FZW96_16520 [Bacillus sp. BGMRC 2118]